MLARVKTISNLLKNNTISSTLDIGAWRWYNALLAASYGSHVDVIEPNMMKPFLFPEFLKWHPSITLYENPVEYFEWWKFYDLIVCCNVIMFLEREYVVTTLLDKINNSLTPWWHFFCSYFDEKDATISKCSNYFLEDFESMKDCNIISHDLMTHQENHPPLWEHTHYIHNILLQNNI